METKKVFLLLPIFLLFLGCPPCEPDEFGEEMILNIPMDFGSDTPVFYVGDTLWIESRFSKDVEVLGHENRIFLEDFRFFSYLYITEISQREARFFVSRNVIEKIGAITISSLNTYNMEFEESDEEYALRAGIVLEIPGNYNAGTGMDVNARSGYRHPSFFSCEDNRRSFVGTVHENMFTSRENLELYNELNNVVIEGFVQTYEGYEQSASFTFQVLE
ncbi:MAG: hypothetical protein AB8H12_09735 [Lewinella sp.]